MSGDSSEPDYVNIPEDKHNPADDGSAVVLRHKNLQKSATTANTSQPRNAHNYDGTCVRKRVGIALEALQ